jgi:hypothetical protein
MKPKLFMETTKIVPAVTVGQIQKLLGEHGASHILMEYENGEISGLVFNIRSADRDMPFRLPCRWRAVLQILQSRRKRHTIRSDWEAQAKRVAWRQILRWVEAQLALVETGMVVIQEVFTPYLIVDKTKTLYEKLESTKFQLTYKEKD